MALSRPYVAGEAPRRCANCGHVVVARPGDACSSCWHPLPALTPTPGGR